MDNTVIRPFQNLLIDAFDQVLAVNDIALNLYFKTLQPLEFTDLTNAVSDSEVEKETGVKPTEVQREEEIKEEEE